MNSSAPLAIFAYARPHHLQRTLVSLLSCEGVAETPITVFIDGPSAADKAEAVSMVHQVALQTLGSGADIRLAPTNLGLSQSITKGVAKLLEQYGRVIVVEDDLELAPGFLRYMNSALNRYEGDQSIYQVSGHMFDVPEFAGHSEAMFLPLTTTWGWATWARAWRQYDPEAGGWQRLRTDRTLRSRFDLEGAYPYSWLMERQQRGLSDSWGIRWYWSVFQAGGLGLFPPQTLIRNIGQDGSGTHGGGTVSDFSGSGLSLPTGVPDLPSTATVDPANIAAVNTAIWRHNGGWRGWALTHLRRTLGR